MKNLADGGVLRYIGAHDEAPGTQEASAPGQVYRREDLARWSNAVDRHLRQLVEEGTLTKLAGGLYAYPKQTVFGKAPAEDDELVALF